MALSMRASTTSRGFLGRKVMAASNGCRVTMKAGE